MAMLQFSPLGSEHPLSFDAAALKAAWPNLGWYPALAIGVEAPESEFAILRKTLNRALGQFYDTDKDAVGSGVSYVITAVG